MTYSSIFRSRMNALGNTAYDRILGQKQRSFDKYFERAINKEPVTVDGLEQLAIIQDQNQNNNKDLSDDKYIVVPKTSNLHTGSYIKWRDKLWMVFSEENKTIPTHKQGKIKGVNHIIKWMVNGEVCGNGNGYPSFVQNQTLYTLGVSSSGNHSWIVNAKMMMYMQDNEETRAIRIGQRIFLGGAVYQVMFKDYVSRKGLINYLMEEDFVNPNIDNIEEEIANYYSDMNSDMSETTVVSPTPTVAVSELVITGSETAKIGSLVTYTASRDIQQWTIADTEATITVVEQTPQYIKLRVVSNFQKVGSTINVIGKAADGAIGTKAVNIISPY